MDKLWISPPHEVTEADLPGARMGTRFGRMDLMSRLALLAVEPLAARLDGLSRDRVGVVLAARAGSVSTDVEYWEGRDRVGGPSPTLFAYTLPSAAIGEIAIRHRLRGPNLCLVGGEEIMRAEAEDLVRRGEARACLGVVCDVVTPQAAAVLGGAPGARVRAVLVLDIGPPGGSTG